MFGAIDIGGTKTLVAIFEKNGDLVNKIRFETPQNYYDFLKELDSTFKSINQTLDLAVVAVPGKLDREAGVAIAFGNLSWTNVPIKSDCEKIFSSEVVIENDAKLAGLSEALALNRSYHKVLYLTISTGIGSGLIIDNHISTDFEDMEAGQMILEHDNKLEHWEQFASGRAIVREFGKPAKDITDERQWYKIAHNIAIGLIDLIANITPDIIIIGGGVGSHFEKFGDRLIEDLKIYQNDLLVIPPIVKAKRAEDAVIYGGYYFAKEVRERVQVT